VFDFKELNKLAKFCRKNGLVSFKVHADKTFEFTLDPSFSPETKSLKSKGKKMASPASLNQNVDTGELDLTDEQKLFWSSDLTKDALA